MNTRKPHFEEIKQHFNVLPADSAIMKSLFAKPIGVTDLSGEFRKSNSILYRYSLLQNILTDKPQYLINRRGGSLVGVNPGLSAWLAIFNKQGADIYKIAREFGSCLNTASLKLSNDHIPATEKMVCIEFPDNIRFRINHSFGSRPLYAHCIYVVISNLGGAAMLQGTGAKISKSIAMLTPHYLEDGSLEVQEMGIDALTINFTSDNETLEEALTRAQNASTTKFNRSLIEYVLKCMAYLHSGEPDLREYKAPRINSNKPKELRKFARSTVNQSLVDMTLVGFDWKKPTVYSVDQTSVSGHFRWQPFGEKRGKVKLIWIDEHVRQFKNEGVL